MCYSFQNPLDVPLTLCSYTVEGPGLQKPKTVSYGNVQPKENVVLRETFRAKRTGERLVVVNFTSKEIQGISGSTKVEVK